MSAFWAKRRVVVTGGTGFLGGHMREALARRGAGRSFFLGRRDYDRPAPRRASASRM